MNDAPDTNPLAALAYIGELVSEYMKTLPMPVRKPVVQAVNQCFEALGAALKRAEDIGKDEIRG